MTTTEADSKERRNLVFVSFSYSKQDVAVFDVFLRCDFFQFSKGREDFFLGFSRLKKIF